MNGRNIHDLTKSGGIPDDTPDDIHSISWDRVGSHTHRSSSKEDRQDLSCPPEGNVSDLHLGRRGFPIVVDAGYREEKLLSPCADGSRHGKHRIDFISRLRLSEFCLQVNPSHTDTDSLRRSGHVIDGPPVFLSAIFAIRRTVACLLCEIKATITGMLTSSFIVLPGVGPVTERRWWQEGVFDWRSFLDRPSIAGLSEHRKIWYDEELRDVQSLMEKRYFHVFGSRLPRREHWRLYETCRSRIGYLDIETTGTSPESGEVTVVGLHRAGKTASLVHGENLTPDRLQDELDHCDLLVTFFGSVFDVPYLSTKFPTLRFPTLHFDLCFAARRLALRGGLKHIEQEMGIDRDTTVRGLDGLDAVRLWFQWRSGDVIARETLLSYNRADTENLVPLADRVYEDMVSRFGPSSITLHPAYSQ